MQLLQQRLFAFYKEKMNAVADNQLYSIRNICPISDV